MMQLPNYWVCHQLLNQLSLSVIRSNYMQESVKLCGLRFKVAKCIFKFSNSALKHAEKKKLLISLVCKMTLATYDNTFSLSHV